MEENSMKSMPNQFPLVVHRAEFKGLSRTCLLRQRRDEYNVYAALMRH